MEDEKAEVRSQKSEEIQNPESKIQNLLDLSAAERFVALKVGERRLIHRFRPPTVDDWLEYERALRPTVVLADEEIETRVSQREASDELWRKRIAAVEGYAPEPLQIVQLGKVPLEHRVLAVSGLDRVQPAADQDVLGDSETVAVKLEAWWNGELYRRLVHRFKRPLVEHELRFQEAAERRTLARTKIGGQKKPGQGTLTTRALPQLPTLIALYDELIVGIDGYGQGAVPVLVANQLMDTPHKAAAVRELFRAERAEFDDPEGDRAR
jgi:hypothetical protein